MRNVLTGLIILILLSPLGLLAQGTAWGEWGLDEIKQHAGFIPQGMARFNEIMKIILPDYAIPGFDKNFFQAALGYIFSALIGIGLIALIFWLFSKLFPEKQTKKVGS
jgi:cobalt/nickel transport protein